MYRSVAVGLFVMVLAVATRAGGVTVAGGGPAKTDCLVELRASGLGFPAGKAVFKAQCAKCHGDSGDSDTSAAKTLKVPKLKGDAKIAGMSNDAIVALVKGNAKHKSFITKLSDEQIGAAAGHAKQLAGGK